MRVLLIGGGGREHALAAKLAASPLLTALICAPGNPGTAAIATNAVLDVANHSAVIDFCRIQSIDLVVIGPEAPLVAGLAGLMLAVIAMAVGHFLNARQKGYRRAGTALATLAETTYAIPGLVISIAFILAFIRPIPVIDVSIYNTLIIIGLAYVCAFLSIALKPVTAACAQLDPALDEAARISGARFFMRMRRIFAPLIAPAAASGAILVFLTAYNEITVSALLWSTGNETIGTTIYNYEDGGYTTLAAAMSAVTVVATIALMVALDRFGKRLPPGVVPWRI